MISFHGEFFWVDVIFFFSFTKFISCVCYFFLYLFWALQKMENFVWKEREERECEGKLLFSARSGCSK